jgi:hypothetical protein
MTLKIEIARRQLGTALKLYLEDADPVSVHCLAGGACELLEHLAKKAGAEPFATHILRSHPDLRDIAALHRLQRQYWNAFKHATYHGGHERNDEDLLERFTDEQNDHVLFIGWRDYGETTGTLPIEAQVYEMCYLAKYPEKLGPVDSYRSHRIVAAMVTMAR